jgi:hypothetical protein
MLGIVASIVDTIKVICALNLHSSLLNKYSYC